jgi:hypothetical protein
LEKASGDRQRRLKPNQEILSSKLETVTEDANNVEQGQNGAVLEKFFSYRAFFSPSYKKVAEGRTASNSGRNAVFITRQA